MYRTEFCTLWEQSRVGCLERTASKHVYYLGWNRSPAQAGCMRQVLGPGALGRPRGIRWRGRWEGESGWGIHVNPWLIHVNLWEKPLQYCKVISLQLKNIYTHKKKIIIRRLKKKCLPCFHPSFVFSSKFFLWSQIPSFTLCLDLVVVDFVLYSRCSLSTSAVALSLLFPKWQYFDLGTSYRVN